MKIRAVSKNGITEVKVLLSHDMETGFRKDDTGKPIPAWFISEVTAKLNDKVVMQASWGPSVSTNPYLAFKIKGGQAGDKVTLSWIDSKGDTRSDEAVVT